MEACLIVEKDVDKVLTKFNSINQHSRRVIVQLIDQVNSLKQELDSAPEGHTLTTLQQDLIKQSMAKVKDTVSRLAIEHRDLHSSVSKVGKSIDRNFTQDFTACSKENVFNDSEKLDLINKIICKHYYRQGMHCVADTLIKESEVKVEGCEKEPFTELHYICDSIKNRDLDPLLAWATAHRESLEFHNSSLEFMIHRLKYMLLLKKGASHQSEAIAYARSYFGQFVKKHEKDIQTLMGMLLYIPNGVNRSPYSAFFEPDNDMWMELYEMFIKDACQLLGVCVNSPLIVCINAGCHAIPALLNIKQVMIQRQVSQIWKGTEELPIEIDLGAENRYHSMFACPILRQQSTKDNPPMKLVCGHVISKDALQKLCNGNKMKCPYCPMEQSPQLAQQVHF
ncbi:LOW QUALITY PROTEIN: E3 ubiquitin-protein ligase RMND5A [Anthonomus grandis grandis]|uniref:LOW QUALITY PROTEIN: E3 ubiquitin-protein ligase RMND5A n=1 Tax=Anthonomus grandis grandis TaxID=2921223 RepID=UPI002165606C|nr:LOW QUALITY PROTEIN: E3 ubiquitin-protein ligase RMND5A [Anthonomus grandis grandis]